MTQRLEHRLHVIMFELFDKVIMLFRLYVSG